MAIKNFRSKSYQCIDIVEPCSRVLFLNTSFVANIANLSGSALVATKPNNILVDCENLSWFDEFSRFPRGYKIQDALSDGLLKTINNSSSPCESWKYNKLASGAYGRVVGTFGQTINVTIYSTGGSQLSGDSELGFTLPQVKSGVALPVIKITTIDAFGNTHAPMLHSEAMVLSNQDGFLSQPIVLSFEDGACIMNSIISFVVPGTYMLQLKPRYDDDILEETSLTILVRNCVINEVSSLEGKVCLTCGEASYNFNLSKEGTCTSCPENANCTTRYIKPKDGYWHADPCHARLKRCIAEEACEFQDRLDNLDNFTRGFDNCSMSKAMLLKYSEVQCRKVSTSFILKDFNEQLLDARDIEVHCVEVVRNRTVVHQL